MNTNVSMQNNSKAVLKRSSRAKSWGMPVLAALVSTASAADWPQWGGSPTRNNAPSGKDFPAEWDIGKFDESSGRKVAEVVRGQIREQGEPHVGRRRPMRDRGDPILLVVVGR